MIEIKTEQELMEKLAALGDINVNARYSVVCSLLGHSKIQEFCLGFYTCTRCGNQVGNSLGGYYPDAENVVVVGHNCPTCRANYEKLDWQYKAFTPYPFSDEEDAETGEEQQ